MSAKSVSAKSVAKSRKKSPDRPRPAAAEAAVERPRPVKSPLLASLLAWVVPGAGHLLLGRLPRAGLFFAVVLTTLGIGCYLDGNMPWIWRGSPLPIVGTLAALGNGLPYLLLRFGFGVAGDNLAPGFDYGSAFVITAGVMNILLVLDAWDIAVGDKE